MHKTLDLLAMFVMVAPRFLDVGSTETAALIAGVYVACTFGTRQQSSVRIDCIFREVQSTIIRCPVVRLESDFEYSVIEGMSGRLPALNDAFAQAELVQRKGSVVTKGIISWASESRVTGPIATAAAMMFVAAAGTESP